MAKLTFLLLDRKTIAILKVSLTLNSQAPGLHQGLSIKDAGHDRNVEVVGEVSSQGKLLNCPIPTLRLDLGYWSTKLNRMKAQKKA